MNEKSPVFLRELRSRGRKMQCHLVLEKQSRLSELMLPWEPLQFPLEFFHYLKFENIGEKIKINININKGVFVPLLHSCVDALAIFLS